MAARPSRPDRRRRLAGAVAAATLLHGAALVALSSAVTTTAPPRDAAPLAVELLRPTSPVPVPKAALPSGTVHPAGPAGTPRSSPTSALRDAVEVARASAAASAASIGAADARATGGTIGMTGAGAAPGADGDALRAIAALFACHGGGGDLDPASRARCEAGRLRAAREAPRVDGVPAEKRDYYDAVVAAHEAERAFRPVGAYYDPRENRGPAIARSHGADAGFGYRCNIALGRGAAEANRRAGVRWAVPPCALKPPVGSLTYEARAPAPLTTAEQAADARAAARLDPIAPRP